MSEEDLIKRVSQEILHVGVSTMADFKIYGFKEAVRYNKLDSHLKLETFKFLFEGMEDAISVLYLTISPGAWKLYNAYFVGEKNVKNLLMDGEPEEQYKKIIGEYVQALKDFDTTQTPVIITNPFRYANFFIHSLGYDVKLLKNR
jgi:hypothetical protein